MIFWLCVVAYGMAASRRWEHYVLSSPQTPVVATGRTTAVAYKGTTFFVERHLLDREERRNTWNWVGGIATAATAFFMNRAAARARHATKGNGSGERDAYAVCPECLGQRQKDRRIRCWHCLGSGFANSQLKS